MARTRKNKTYSSTCEMDGKMITYTGPTQSEADARADRFIDQNGRARRVPTPTLKKSKRDPLVTKGD